ncbi:hypothetical protein BH23CHL5_BH23CHL5_26240 [soil metagenome]
MSYEAKTVPTSLSLENYLSAIDDNQRQTDCRTLAAMMTSATGNPAVLWGSSIVGFGKYRYTYETGHSGESPMIGFAPRSRQITFYIMSGIEIFDDLTSRLGKFKKGKACLYIRRLADVDLEVLDSLIEQSVQRVRETNEST